MTPTERLDLAVQAVLGIYAPFGCSPAQRCKMARIWIETGVPMDAVSRIRPRLPYGGITNV